MKTLKSKLNCTGRKKTQCQICFKVVKGNSFHFKSHLYKHNVTKMARFKCSYCSKEYFRRDSYKKHINFHKGIRKYHICDHCDRGFVDKRNLIAHLRVHDEYCNISQGQYKCMACGIRYCEERLLKYHIRKQHYNLHEKVATYDKKKPSETWVEYIKQSETSVEITKINDNVIVIKKCPTLKKNECCSETLEQSHLQDYMMSVFAKTDNSHYSKAICDYCKKEMLKKSLISHIRERHFNLRRFKCDVCNESFSRHYQMVDHKCGMFKAKKRK